MMHAATGALIGIARKGKRRAAMETVRACAITVGAGLAGDHSGAKFPKRGVTVLAREAWEAALADLERSGNPAKELTWLARRANLLVEGVTLPRAKGGVVRVGPVILEVTDQTVPCGRMDEAHPGLLKALYPDWRGGICCRVVSGGTVREGDRVEVLVAPPQQEIHLPGE